jgi:hypothetical protein
VFFVTQKNLNNILSPPPYTTPMTTTGGIISPVWMMWFQKVNQRLGGAYSQTIPQNTDSISMAAFSDSSVESSESEASLDALNVLMATQPIAWREDELTDIPSISQRIEYEEGTWNPILVGAMITGTVTTLGSYTKIGNQVFWDATVNADAGSVVTSFSSFSDLPYPATVAGIVSAVNLDTNADLGSGRIVGDAAFIPNFTLTGEIAIISGRHQWQ